MKLTKAERGLKTQKVQRITRRSDTQERFIKCKSLSKICPHELCVQFQEPTLGLPAVAFLREQPRHSISSCSLAPSPWWPVPASSATLNSLPVLCLSLPSSFPGEAGAQSRRQLQRWSCWHASQLTQSLSFQREFTQTPEESPTTPWN